MEKKNTESSSDTKADLEILRGFISNQLAKFEAKELVQDRLALKAKTRGKPPKKGKNEITSTDDLEHMYKLIECLPQGNRCTQPPREPFLDLAREMASKSEDPLKTLETALLLEEYTIQLLEEYGCTPESRNSQPISPWALACSGIPQADMTASQKETLHSKRYALQLHWILEQLSTGAYKEDEAGGEQQRGKRPQKRGRRRRKRKRAPRSEKLMEADDLQLSEAECQESQSKKVKTERDGRAKRKVVLEYSSSENYKSEDSISDSADSDACASRKEKGEESQSGAADVEANQ
ncbi:unnamed protein product [Agarophyton chilense]